MAAIPLVAPIQGEALRFHVRSRTTPGLCYLVDLESYSLNGECGCDHFAFRLRPQLDDTPKPTPRDSTRCWHIMQARRWLLDQFLEKLAEEYGDARRPERFAYAQRHD